MIGRNVHLRIQERKHGEEIRAGSYILAVHVQIFVREAVGEEILVNLHMGFSNVGYIHHVIGHRFVKMVSSARDVYVSLLTLLLNLDCFHNHLHMFIIPKFLQ